MSEAANNSNITAMSTIQEDYTTLHVFNAMVLVLSVGGFILNIITLIVLCKQRDKTSTVYILIGLISSDVCNAVHGFLHAIFIYFYIFERSVYLTIFSKSTSTYVNTVLLTPAALSRVFTMLISCERVFAVWTPLKFRTIWTPTVGKCVTICAYIITIGLCFTPYFTNDRRLFLSLLLSYKVIPVFVVIVCTTVTIIGLKLARMKVHVASNAMANTRQSIENKNTRLLVGLCFLFMLCSLVSLTLSFLLLRRGYDLSARIVRMAGTLTELSYSFLNSVIVIVGNPFYRKQYRKIVSRLFSFCIKSTSQKNTTSRAATDTVSTTA